jgi:hypothetical protein
MQGSLPLGEVARRLEQAGVVWAVFAGAASAAYGSERPLTDVDILVPLGEGTRVATLLPGAETCQAVVDAVSYGQTLLADINFDGTGDYLRPKGQTKADYHRALELADFLDQYNNGLLCGEGTPPPPPPPPEIDSYMHISDLDGTATEGSRGRWTAEVTIYVRDVNGNPVSGADVSGEWSDGAKGGATCTTDGAGVCPPVSKGNLKSNVLTVKFTVTGASKDSYIYDPEGILGGVPNGDPDGDSDGTTIIVSKQ